MKMKKLVYPVLLVLLVSIGIYKTPSTMAAAAQAGVWTWPLDGDIVVLENVKYGTTLENTNYDVINRDLVHPSQNHITCFDVGWHSIYHAGVDFYRSDGNTANALVRAVSDGQVVYVGESYPGFAIIIYHPIGSVYSVYMHLKDNVLVSQSENVVVGQPLGYVRSNEYYGRFPDVHPFGSDDSHLHFEIRTFSDGSNLFPPYPRCDLSETAWGALKAGLGYSYPDHPDSFGYLNPIQWLDDHIADPPMPYKTFLPVVFSSETCIEGQDLIQYNSGYEGPTDNPAPWIEITTYFDPPNWFYYHIVKNDSYLAYNGNHFAFFGNQVFFSRIVDEEMPQSVRIPAGVSSLEWIQHIWLEKTGGLPGDYGTEFGDRHILTLKDARTGLSVISDQVIDHTSSEYPINTWLTVSFTIYNASALSNQLVSASYSSITDGDVNASTMRVDEVSLISHCNLQP